MKKFNYESPDISILMLGMEDVIATSGEGGSDLGGTGDDDIIDW